MDDKFVVQFEADIAKWVSDLDTVKKTLGEARSGVISLDDAIDKVGGQVSKTSKSMQDVSKSIGGADNATKDFNQSAKKTTENLSTQRYALYDVASSYGAISAALLAVSGVSLKVGADFETAFTHVERTLEKGTTQRQIADLEQQLVDLSTQIPLTFAEISEIATLGNQLGIASEDVTAFTETVAQFSTIAGISVEETALAFGQLGNLLGVQASEFNRLGSAIALVGVNSAATEKQIVSVAREIAPAARAAGFTAEQVVGLSGALASIRVPPERSRSTMLQFFETLNTAVASGGQGLQDFATIVGVTTSELDRMVRQGEGEDILRRFIGTLDASDTIEITQALDRLNLAGLRVNPTVRALSDNTELLNQTFADSAVGWAEGTEQAVQFSLIVDNLASQFQMFINAVNALIVELTGGLVPGLAGVLDVGVDFVNWLRDIAQNDAIRAIGEFVIVLTTVIGVMAAVRTATALAAASTIALAQAQGALGTTSVLGTMGRFIGVMMGFTTVTDGATRATWNFRTALMALGRALVIGAVIYTLSELVFNFGGAMQWVGGVIQAVGNWIGNVFQAASIAVTALANSLSFLEGPLRVISALLGVSGAVISNSAGAFSRWADGLTSGAKGMEDFSSAGFDLDGMMNQLNGSLGAGSANFDDLGQSASKAAEEIRTVADYASDLRGVFDRAFDIQFGPQTALDSITLKWIELNEQMRDYRAEVARLTADRAVKEYFLSIAEAYDDQLRAGQLRADLLEIDGKLADAQANVSRETQGNSKAAAQNRGTLQDLVKQYSEYITALASSGLNQDELTAAVNTSIAEFRAQATQLGFSDAALQPYISSLQGLITVINSVPRNISPNLEVRGISAADAAVREFMARARSAVGGGINVPITTSGGGGSLINDLNAQIRGLQARKAALGNDNWSFSDRVAIEKQIQGLQAQIRGIRGWESGGYTGNGGTSAPAGIVHGKEFVFNAQATKNAGVGNLYGMMRAFEQGRGYQAGGYVSAAPSAPSGFGMVVELSPTDRRLLAAAGNVTLTLDGRIVADSTNTVNGVYAKRGA